MTFLAQPREACSERTDLLLLVLSTLARRAERDQWRARLEGQPRLRGVFIVALTDQEPEDVLEEAEAEGDILFPALRDGHLRLSYKVRSFWRKNISVDKFLIKCNVFPVCARCWLATCGATLSVDT